jgi:cysteine desulfurase
LPSVIACINAVQRDAWGNPSSLHGTGLVAAEQLARSRQTIAAQLCADEDELIFTSGATESVTSPFTVSPLVVHRDAL